jgi:hypothetical protein
LNRELGVMTTFIRIVNFSYDACMRVLTLVREEGYLLNLVLTYHYNVEGSGIEKRRAVRRKWKDGNVSMLGDLTTSLGEIFISKEE